jgi:hypothetical protein
MLLPKLLLLLLLLLLVLLLRFQLLNRIKERLLQVGL